jgi:hypothetical protein
VLLWFCGLQVGKVFGLHRCDLRFVILGRGPRLHDGGRQLHVISRDNANGARAKSAAQSVPVAAKALALL